MVVTFTDVVTGGKALANIPNGYLSWRNWGDEVQPRIIELRKVEVDSLGFMGVRCSQPIETESGFYIWDGPNGECRAC